MLKSIKIIIKRNNIYTFYIRVFYSFILIPINGYNDEILVCKTDDGNGNKDSFFEENQLQPCYIRIGEIPINEKSKNHLTNEYENGVSVFNGVKYKDDYLPIIEVDTNTFGRFSPLDNILSHNVYVVSGDVSGIGSDGEPLLVNVKKEKEIKLKIYEVTEKLDI